MLCKDIMTKNIITATSLTEISEVCKLMEKNNIGFIPVLEEEKTVGVITDRDIIKRVLAKGKEITSKVFQYMSVNVICVNENEDITIAISKMADHQIKRIVVLNDNNILVGIITIKDLVLNKETNQYVNELLKEISDPTSLVTNPIKYLKTDDVVL